MPAGIAGDVTHFERETNCRVDLRVYDEEEDVEAIARRRDVDVVAGLVPAGARPQVSEESSSASRSPRDSRSR